MQPESPIIGTVEDPYVGRTFGRWWLVERIGEGGVGLVYLAQNEVTGDIAALKFMREEYRTHRVVVAHFWEECRVVVGLRHPNILHGITFRAGPEGPFLCAKFIDGQTLAELISESGPVDPPTALQVMDQRFEALDHLHGRRIAHLDVKPDNVMVDRDGRVRVLDLGLARLQVESNLERSLAASLVSVDGRSIAGTLDYMAPELFEGKAPPPASDLYGLGVLLHHLLTGRPPAFGVSPVELQPYLTPGLPELLYALLAQDPARRLQSANTVAEILRAMATAERRCLARRNGHERRRVFQHRMTVLRRGLKAALSVIALPVVFLAVIYAAKVFPGGSDLGDDMPAVVVVAMFAVLVSLVGMVLAMTTINAWIAGVPERLYKNRPGHALWSFMMQ